MVVVERDRDGAALDGRLRRAGRPYDGCGRGQGRQRRVGGRRRGGRLRRSRRPESWSTRRRRSTNRPIPNQVAIRRCRPRDVIGCERSSGSSATGGVRPPLLGRPLAGPTPGPPRAVPGPDRPVPGRRFGNDCRGRGLCWPCRWFPFIRGSGRPVRPTIARRCSWWPSGGRGRGGGLQLVGGGAFRPRSDAVVNGFFSDLEVAGRPHAAQMSDAEMAAGLLMVVALLLRGPGARHGVRREWKWMVAFAVAGAVGGRFPYACSEGLSATCRSLEWHLGCRRTTTSTSCPESRSSGPSRPRRSSPCCAHEMTGRGVPASMRARQSAGRQLPVPRIGLSHRPVGDVRRAHLLHRLFGHGAGRGLRTDRSGGDPHELVGPGLREPTAGTTWRRLRRPLAGHRPPAPEAVSTEPESRRSARAAWDGHPVVDGPERDRRTGFAARLRLCA